MANPNKTVANYRAKVGFTPKHQREQEPFFKWLFSDLQRSAQFNSVEEAHDAYLKELAR